MNPICRVGQAKRGPTVRFTRKWWDLLVFAAFFLSPCISLAQSPEAENNDIPEEYKSIKIKLDDRELFEYLAVESPNKPYVKKLFAPGGVQILRDSPEDHKHHHALMFALTAGNVDFWGEESGAGIEKAAAMEFSNSTSNGILRAVIKQRVDWTDPKSDASIVREYRKLRGFASPEIKATLLSWHSTLKPAEGKDSVVLGGGHYFGLGMRFVVSMDVEGEFLFADDKEGETVRGTEKLTPARWCAYRSKADGKPVTVAIFDSPDNPRHPNRFFTMTQPFAYLSATLNLWKEPMTLKAGETLKLSYGVAAWDGHVEPAEIEKTYGEWLKLDKDP
jgi:hypothetical protein